MMAGHFYAQNGWGEGKLATAGKGTDTAGFWPPRFKGDRA